MKFEVRNLKFEMRRCGAGFTLAELLVAVAVTAVLIIAISRIFDSVGKAVARGQAASDILANSRIVGDQIERDFQHMIGPGDGGVLVIVSQAISDVKLNESEPNDLPSNLQRRRSDQLMFIRRRGDAEPLTPGGTNNFNSGSRAAYLRVWYGHGKRTNDDGSAGGDLGDNGRNKFAGDWVLCRHALFLDPTSSGVPKAVTAYADSDLTSSLGFGGTGKLYSGLLSLTKFGLNTGGNGFMVGSFKPSDTSDIDHADKILWSNLSPAEYSTRAYNYMFLDDERLWVNPRPVMDATDGYEAWQIAQMHPYLAGHVSHIQVDFAGDYDGDDSDAIDTDPNDNIIWYGMGNNPDVGGPGKFVEQTNDDPNNRQPIRDNSNGSNDIRFIFRHGSASATNWPRLIRIRYRIHDRQGLISGPDGLPGRSFEQIMRVVRQ